MLSFFFFARALLNLPHVNFAAVSPLAAPALLA